MCSVVTFEVDISCSNPVLQLHHLISLKMPNLAVFLSVYVALDCSTNVALSFVSIRRISYISAIEILPITLS